MSNIENRAILRDKYKTKHFEMKGLAEGYDTHMLDVTQICSKSWKAVTSHILLCVGSRLVFYLQVMLLILRRFMV